MAWQQVRAPHSRTRALSTKRKKKKSGSCDALALRVAWRAPTGPASGVWTAGLSAEENRCRQRDSHSTHGSVSVHGGGRPCTPLRTAPAVASSAPQKLSPQRKDAAAFRDVQQEGGAGARRPAEDIPIRHALRRNWCFFLPRETQVRGRLRGNDVVRKATAGGARVGVAYSGLHREHRGVRRGQLQKALSCSSAALGRTGQVPIVFAAKSFWAKGQLNE